MPINKTLKLKGVIVEKRKKKTRKKKIKDHLLVTPIMIYLLMIFSHISSEPFVDKESKRAKKGKKKKEDKI